MKRFLLFGIICGLLMLPSAALADSITPDSFSATLMEGDSVTITKTVTVEDAPPTTAPVDVFFLSDSTGSMMGYIASVKAGASTILSSTSGLGDVHYGVGEYRDFGDAFTYRTNQDLTGDTAAVQAGINALSAGGGGDWEEAQLYALTQVANTVSWRPGSTRMVVWFGDAPGHDPSGGATLGSTTTALQSQNISVEALDVASMDVYGQVTSITTATGGHIYTGASTSGVVTEITNAITTALEDYTSVALDVSGAPAGVDVAVSPGVYVGDWERDVDRDFLFDVTFTGITPGTYDFPIHALVDGGRVATEDDSITVTVIPEPTTMLLLGCGLLGLAGFRRKFFKG
jgi:hypothetical protein